MRDWKLKDTSNCGLMLLALLAAASPQLRAQFQAPDPAEFSMAADPKAPGAAAVYMDREESVDFDKQQYVYYARIKVLTEKGKELATVKVPYDRGDDKVKIEGRTVHADGTIVPLNVKPEDLLEYKTKYVQENSMVFTLPSVEVGSLLEYRVTIDEGGGLSAPTWELQHSYFIHQEHFSFNSGTGYTGGYRHGQELSNLMVEQLPVPPPYQLKIGKGKATLDLTDVPAAPDEDWMPPMNTLRWRVDFYYTYAKTPDEFWKKEADFWKSDAEDFAKVTGTIRKAAAGLVSDSDSEEQKARKIYAAVEKLDITDFSREKSEAERKKLKLKENNNVEDVWKNQGGPGNSVALLYVALARAAGLKAWPMIVTDRNINIFDYGFLNTRQMDDYIAVVSLGGKEVYLDPAQKRSAFGTLHWAHMGAMGFRESDAGPVLAQTPAPKYQNNGVQRFAELTVDAEGNVTGSGRVLLKGAEALYWRQRALENSEDEVRKEFEEELNAALPEGVEARFDHFLALDDGESLLMAVANVHGKMGTVTGKRLILPGLFFETRAKHPFVAEAKRQVPVDLHYPLFETDEVTYTLPEGFAAQSTPQTDNLNWAGSAMLHIASTAEGGTITVKRSMVRNFSYVLPGGYGELHDFYQKLATADQQQIVLTRAAAVKEN